MDTPEFVTVDLDGYFSRVYLVDARTSYNTVFGDEWVPMYGNGGPIKDYEDYFAVIPTSHKIFQVLFFPVSGERGKGYYLSEPVQITDRESVLGASFASRAAREKGIGRGLQLDYFVRYGTEPAYGEVYPYVNPPKLFRVLRGCLEPVVSGGPVDGETVESIGARHRVNDSVRSAGVLLGIVEEAEALGKAGGYDPLDYAFDGLGGKEKAHYVHGNNLVGSYIPSVLGSIDSKKLAIDPPGDYLEMEALAYEEYRRRPEWVARHLSLRMESEIKEYGGLLLTGVFRFPVPKATLKVGFLSSVRGFVGNPSMGEMRTAFHDRHLSGSGATEGGSFPIDEARMVVLSLPAYSGAVGAYGVLTVSFPVYLIREPSFSHYSFDVDSMLSHNLGKGKIRIMKRSEWEEERGGINVLSTTSWFPEGGGGRRDLSLRLSLRGGNGEIRASAVAKFIPHLPSGERVVDLEEIVKRGLLREVVEVTQGMFNLVFGYRESIDPLHVEVVALFRRALSRMSLGCLPRPASEDKVRWEPLRPEWVDRNSLSNIVRALARAVTKKLRKTGDDSTSLTEEGVYRGLMRGLETGVIGIGASSNEYLYGRIRSSSLRLAWMDVLLHGDSEWVVSSELLGPIRSESEEG